MAAFNAETLFFVALVYPTIFYGELPGPLQVPAAPFELVYG